MAGIQTSIELNDQFSSVLYSIIGSVNLAVSSMYDMQESMNADIDTGSLEAARNEINQATAAIVQMNEALSSQVMPEVPSVSPEPVEIPVTWNTDGLDVFTGTGIDRFEQEVQSTNSMLEQLSSTQDAIAKQAYSTNIFPPEAFQNLNSLAVRIDMVRERIQMIENNPVNIGTDAANAELEQLRSQLNRAVQEQNELNSAMQRMDVSAANTAYLNLSQTVGNTERYIRDNVDEQGRFNQEIRAGTQDANTLADTIKSAVAAYVSIQSVGKVIDVSDGLTQTIARLNLMNDGAQSTQELFNMIYASAQKTHSPIMDTADAIARMGNNAGAAFSSNVELVAFMDQVNKQFAIGGATATEQSNALLQLSQAMAAGALRGDELNSILDAAPGIARTIEESMGWAEGSIKSYAEEGEVTAQVVKYSLLNMADETNEAFESMPITFSQAMTDLKSTAVDVFQPVLQRLNDVANSEGFQEFTNGIVEAMAVTANVILNTFDLISKTGSFVANNWSVIGPIVYGVAAAFAVYNGYLLITKGLELAGIAASTAHAVAMSAKIGITAALTGSTMAATAAQMGYNGALYACPIVWIIVLVIALIAGIIALCNWIAKTTDITNSGLGLIAGVLATFVAFNINLILGLINTIISLAINFYNMGANFAAAFGILFDDPVAAIKATILSLFKFIVHVVAEAAVLLDTVFGSHLSDVVSGFQSDIQAKIDATIESAGGDTAKTLNPNDYMLARVNYSDAFNTGASLGDGLADKISNFSLSDLFGKVDIPNPDDYTAGFGDAIKNTGLGSNVSDISDNTSAIKDSVDISNEDLKYLRDIAEQEAINRFTTAEIKVDMSGMSNTVNNTNDLDGIVDGLTTKVLEAMETVKEGG